MTDEQLVDRLLLEWSWRCEKGYPDPNNEKDVKILEELFKINLRGQQLSQEAKGDKDDMYALDYKTFKEEDKKIYVLKKDLEQEGNSDTQKIKPNADRFVQDTKGRYIKLDQEEPTKNQSDQSEEEDKKYVESELHKVGIENIEQITENPLFGTATSIEEFKAKAPDYLNAFKELYTYKGEQGGRGELIPLVAIKGAKLGGGNKKDITVNAKVLEVKEISKGKDSGEFSTGTSGMVIESKFIKNFDMFKKGLKPFEADFEYEQRLRALFLIRENSISTKNFNYLRDLLKNFPISKESLSTDFERIKFKGKYYAISKGGEATFKLDSSGNLISSTEQLRELESKQVAIQKILTHTWVKDPQELENNLNELRDKAMSGVNYYLFFKKEDPNFIHVVDSKVEKEKIQFHRITKSQVNLKYVHTDKQ